MNKEILEWINKQIKSRTSLLSMANKPKGPICINSGSLKNDLKILNQIKKELEEKDKLEQKQMLNSREEEPMEAPVLDDVEKRYLKNVLKPFKGEIKSIYKSVSEYYEKEDLTIELKADIIRLPYFKKGTMYKGMEVGKDYTLEELGIKYEKKE